MQCAVYLTQYAMKSLQYAVCSVQCIRYPGASSVRLVSSSPLTPGQVSGSSLPAQPDLVLGADLVYDSSLLPSLVCPQLASFDPVSFWLYVLLSLFLPNSRFQQFNSSTKKSGWHYFWGVVVRCLFGCRNGQ